MFKNLSIRKKIMASFIAVIVLILILGTYLTNMIAHLGAEGKDLYENSTVGVELSGEIMDHFDEIRIIMRDLVRADNEGLKEKFVIDIESNLELIRDNNVKLNKILSKEMDPKLIQNLALADKEFNGLLKEYITLIREGKNNDALLLVQRDGKLFKAEDMLDGAIGDISSGISSLADMKAKRNATDASRSVWIAYAAILLIAILALLLGTYISGKISKPLMALQKLMEKAAEGDFTKRGDVLSTDETGVVTKSLNSLLDKTSEALSKIKTRSAELFQSADALLDVAGKLTQNSQSTSGKTSVVSAAVEEISVSIGQTASSIGSTSNNINTIASAIEEISNTIRGVASASEQTSIGVKQAAHLVGDMTNSISGVSDSAKHVLTSVNGVVTSIKEISHSLNEVSKNCDKSLVINSEAGKKAQQTNQIITTLNEQSKQIGKIVNVINDIADQTNMLALNAAIEAAGAGEAGKGFAVVANEVKELAKQTAEATDEISQQIDNMQSNMTMAVQAVSGITTVITEISDITTTISGEISHQNEVASTIATSSADAAQKVSNITAEISKVSEHAKDVAKNVDESAKGVVEIAKSTAELSKASTDISMNVERASNSLSEINKATQEISKGAVEISKNIQEIHKKSEETSDWAKTTNASAKGLGELSGELDKVVGWFKL